MKEATHSKSSLAFASMMVVFSVLYIVLAAKAYNTLDELEGMLKYRDDGDEKAQWESNFRGGKAACVLSIAAVIFFSLFYGFLLLSAYFNATKIRGGWYGVFITASIYTSAFMLLTGIVLQANHLDVESDRPQKSEREFTFAYIMAYVLTATFILCPLFFAYQRLRGKSAFETFETIEHTENVPRTDSSLEQRL